MRSNLCGCDNSHSATFVLDPLEPRVLLSVGEVGQDAPTLSWGIDVADSTGPGVTDVTPTGTQFTLFDYYGGTWVDCEKSPTDADDNNLCWAAAASNVLDWTGWGFVSGMTNSDQIFTYFQDHYEDDAGAADAAWQWWFTGVNPNEPWCHVNVPGAGFYTSLNFNDYIHRFSEPKSDIPSGLADFLGSGYGVAIMLQGGASHAVTCWGYNYNANYPSQIYGVWLTDSDDDKNSVNPPNRLRYYEIAQNTDGKWYLQNYYGMNNVYLSDVYGLEPNAWANYPFNNDDFTAQLYTNPFGDVSLTGQTIGAAGTRANYTCALDWGGSTIMTTAGSTDTELAWYDQIGRPRQIDNDSGPGANAQITATMATGQLYGISVAGHGSATGTYDLLINGPTQYITTLAPDAAGHALHSDTIQSEYDADFYSFTTTRSGTWEFKLTCNFGFDGTMIVYDAAGNPVAGSYTSVIDAHGSGGTETWSTRAAAGTTFYVRVDGHNTYTGGYTLEMVPPPTPDLVAAGFSTTTPIPPADGSISASFSIRNQGQANATSGMVAFYLSTDAVITTADQLLTTTSFPAIAAGGQYNGSCPLNLPEPTPLTNNQYYIGMIVDYYNQVDESNETNNGGQGLGLDLFSIQEEKHLASPSSAGVAAETLTLGQPLSASIGDEWVGDRDVDTFAITLTGETWLAIDLDRTAGTLDSYIRLYDQSWTLVASNDDRAAPGEILKTSDSYLEYHAPAAQTLYLAVSASGNHTSDPRQLAGRTSASTGAYTLTAYQMTSADPTVAPDLLATSDTGVSDHDDLTNLDNSTGRTLSFRLWGLPNAAAYLWIDGRRLGTATFNSEGWCNVSTTSPRQLADGEHEVWLRQQEPGKAVSTDSPSSGFFVDATPPTVAGQQVNDGLAERSRTIALQVSFGEPVMIDMTSLRLQDLTHGVDVDVSNMSGAYDSKQSCRWSLMGVKLDNARYEARVPAGSVRDLAGNSLAADWVMTFHQLTGDANGDATVDVGDLAILGANYGLSGASQPGNMNADSMVDVGDLGILGANYGRTLASVPAALAAVVAGPTALRDDATPSMLDSFAPAPLWPDVPAAAPLPLASDDQLVDVMAIDGTLAAASQAPTALGGTQIVPDQTWPSPTASLEDSLDAQSLAWLELPLA